MAEADKLKAHSAEYLRGLATELSDLYHDDDLQLEVSITRLGTTACATRHRVLRDGDPLVEGRMRHVFVDPTSLQKIPIPDWLRESLAPWVMPDGDA